MPGLVIRFINDVDIVSKLITWSTNSLWCHTEALSRDGTTWVGARVFWRPDVSNVESWQHADEHTAEILSERD